MTKAKPSLIVRRMKRPALLFVVLAALALPSFAQSSEVGITFGGGRRTANEAVKENDVPFLNDEFSFSNSAIDIFWGIQIEEGTYFKIKGGRIETPVAIDVTPEGATKKVRRDVEGEVQHIEANIEYRFSEAFGSTALFGGLGFYKHSGEGIDSTADYGFNAGVNADFPITRRYGFVIEGTYHWTRADFRPRYLTLGAGLRVAF